MATANNGVTRRAEALDRWKGWLDLEVEAEEEKYREMLSNYSLEQLRADGTCLADLYVKGGYQTFDVTFTAGNNRNLPDHKLSSGDAVTVSLMSDFGRPLLHGTVEATDARFIRLTVDDNFQSIRSTPSPKSETFFIMAAPNLVTINRLFRVISQMEQPFECVGSGLIQHLFHDRPLQLDDESPSCGEFLNAKLNASQQKAVARCVDTSRPVSVIHGPPGTGKTQTLTEVIAQCVRNNGEKLLVCAPSNVGVDNVMERVLRAHPHIRALRLGRPVRVSPLLYDRTFEVRLRKELAARREAAEEQEKMFEEQEAKMREKRNEKRIMAIVRAIRRLWKEEGKEDEDDDETDDGSDEDSSESIDSDGFISDVDLLDIRRRRPPLEWDARQQRTEVARELIGSAQVVFSTLTSCPDYKFPLMLLSGCQKENFDVCIIDECAQSLEVACWMGLMQARRCVLAGDHKQLPPTVKSERAAEEGLSLSLMERLSNEFSGSHDQLFTLLNVQYRMNEHIMRWSSDTFYESQLTADESVAKHLLSDLDGLGRLTWGGRPANLTVSDKPLVLVDTCGQMPEAFRGNPQQKSHSKSNPDEVNVVYLYVRLLVEQGVQQEDIAVISPYSGQGALLKRYVGSRYPDVAIRTVDGFQGQEREVVIMSFVRSNKHGNVGFLSDARRLNVAVTRARRQLCVVADVHTVQSDDRLRTLVEHIKESNQALCINHCELNAKLDWPLPFRIPGVRFPFWTFTRFESHQPQQTAKLSGGPAPVIDTRESSWPSLPGYS